MQLIADRFAVDGGGNALDLATGACVALVIEPAGEVAQQLRWSERCEMLHTIRHHAVAPLVDFGLSGPDVRFEAWACGLVWRGSPDEMHRVGARAMRFLRAMRVSTGDADNGSIGTSRAGMGIWVPGAGSGYPCTGDDASGAALPLAEHGIRLVDRPAVAALAEMFRQPPDSRSQIACVWGPRESGKRCAIDALARAARLRGFVPVAAHLVDSSYAHLWHGRSLLVIASGDATPWRAFLEASLRIAQPHVLLVVGDTECRGVDGVPLRAVPADALVGAVRPRVAGGPLEAVVRRAAEHARGLPGRFARRLWRQPWPAPARERSGQRRLPMAAERPAAYGTDEAPAGPIASPIGDVCEWPAPGELAALRRRIDAARAMLAAGRHAPGIRELRQAAAGLARRGAWGDAAAGGVLLASALLRRGRPTDAQKAIEDAEACAGRAGGETRLVDLATLSGEAWIDRARLDEAERLVATALAAARTAGDAERLAAACLTMTRCLLWRGRSAEAAGSLDRCPASMPPHLAPRRAVLASRVAVALGDFGAALSAAGAAADLASAARTPDAAAAAIYARAVVHLAVGDLDAVERDVAASIEAARSAHDPLRALRARLLRAEAERRRGRTATAASQLERLRRVTAGAPPLLRARWELASALCARGDVSASSIVERQIAATGLGGLALYAPPCGAASASIAPGDPFLEHVVSILHVCQTAEDDAIVLKDVCVRVRQHLHAAAVAFVAHRDGRARVVAADGPRIEGDIAERAVTAATTIAPHRRDDRIEAAAPVKYGGAPVAAICARWTLGSTYDVTRAAPVLAMTAAAAAPVVAMALETHARQEQQASAGESELLGVSPAIVDLRRSVASAAAAPFAVLISGESGSGKELVARAIHRGGARRHKPFCTLNCAALPDDLVEAELFGHARGSFTGAVLDRAGVFEEAHGGTLFLDEIGEMSPRAQAKVLRVIQEGELRRVGETASRRIDVRIISASNRDLRREVEAGRFRLDLLYRLDVVHIAVPRLCDRREDVPVFADHFWRDAAARVGSRATLGAATVAALTRYDWPGNVRELQNVLAALAVRCPKRGVVPPTALPPAFAGGTPAAASRLDEARRTFEERFVRAALVRTGGHRGRAAEELGVTRQGLTKLMTRLGIPP